MLLFSYGALQQEDVQMSTFGQLLAGCVDPLAGHGQSMIEAGNADVVGPNEARARPLASGRSAWVCVDARDASKAE